MLCLLFISAVVQMNLKVNLRKELVIHKSKCVCLLTEQRKKIKKRRWTKESLGKDGQGREAKEVEIGFNWPNPTAVTDSTHTLNNTSC